MFSSKRPQILVLYNNTRKCRTVERQKPLKHYNLTNIHVNLHKTECFQLQIHFIMKFLDDDFIAENVWFVM